MALQKLSHSHFAAREHRVHGRSALACEGYGLSPPDKADRRIKNSLTGKKTKEAERLRRYTHEVKTEEHDKDSEEKTILPVHSKHNSVCSKIINASSTFVIICSSPFDRFPQTCYNHASKRSICLLSIYSAWCSFSGYYVSHSALVPHQCFSSWHQWMH